MSEFLDFADFTIELCDGNPTYLENDVDGWIANTGGQICFWNYTVIDELEIVPEPATLELLSGGLVVAMWVACRRRRQSVGSAVGR